MLYVNGAGVSVRGKTEQSPWDLSPQHIIPRSRSEEQEERRQRGRRSEPHTLMSPDRSLSGSGYRTQNTKIKDMISAFGTLQPASVDVLQWAG